ncbi:hypothetical protein [Microbacterium algeriense]|nr:hypothetical protein [Microbacterium algeriense]MDX2399120.1 hypothetical protein [Microbacterium algeriense]
MSHHSVDGLLRPLVILPPLAGMFFAAVTLMATRAWGFSVVSGVVVFFGSFVVLAIMYLFVDVADSVERRVGLYEDSEQSR